MIPLRHEKVPTGVLSLNVPTETLYFISKDQIYPISAREWVVVSSFADAVGGKLDILAQAVIPEYQRLGA